MYIKKSVTVGETAEILLQEKIKKKKQHMTLRETDERVYVRKY